MALRQTEKSFQAAVVGFAQLRRWRVHHQYDARRSTPGLPDLLLVRPPRVVFLELKTNAGRPTQAQLDWLGDLVRCPGVEAYMLRPSDWPQIQAVLR